MPACSQTLKPHDGPEGDGEYAAASDARQVSATPGEPGLRLFGAPGGEADVVFAGRAATHIQQHTFPNDGGDFDPASEPSGRRMVFASTRHSRFSHLYSKSVDGATITQITDGQGNDAQPVFSPDGRRIAFASDRSGNWDIWVVDADGRNVAQITNGPTPELHPSWSPDGRRLVYSRVNPPNGFGELWVVELANPGMRKLIGEGLFPAWSPRGDRIAYQRAREHGSRLFSIWTLDLVNDEPRYPTEIVGSAEGGMITPKWSPDGERITFAAVSNPDNVPASLARAWSSPGRSAIGIVDADGRGKQILTNDMGECYSPCWSRDGRIYFTARVESREAIWSVQPFRADGDPGTPAADARRGVQQPYETGRHADDSTRIEPVMDRSSPDENAVQPIPVKQ